MSVLLSRCATCSAPDLNVICQDAGNGHADPGDTLRTEVDQRKLDALAECTVTVAGWDEEDVAGLETACGIYWRADQCDACTSPRRTRARTPFIGSPSVADRLPPTAGSASSSKACFDSR